MKKSLKSILIIGVLLIGFCCQPKENVKEEIVSVEIKETIEVKPEKVNFYDTVKINITNYIDTVGFSEDYLSDFYQGHVNELGQPYYRYRSVDSVLLEEQKFWILDIIGSQYHNKSESNAYRLIIVDDQRNTLYDTEFYDPECDVFGYSCESLRLDSILGDTYLVFTEKKYKHPCCGASEEIILTDKYTHPQNLRQDFQYVRYHNYLNYGDCQDANSIQWMDTTTLEKIDQFMFQLSTKHTSEGKLNSIKSENVFFSEEGFKQ